MNGTADEGAALAERVRRRDRPAEDELVHTFGPRVFAMAVARIRDREAARDLTQDIMWAVVQALRGGRLREAERLAGFIAGTARNLINNYLRTQARAHHEVPLDPGLLLFDPGRSPEQLARVTELRRVVSGLDPTDRQILLLTLDEGLTLAEIAARLGLGHDAVRQRKSRSIRKITESVVDRSQI